MKEALDDQSQGVNIHGIPTNYLKYAADTVLLSESNKNLQALIDDVEASEEFHY